jgi:hypothetical protein
MQLFPAHVMPHTPDTSHSRLPSDTAHSRRGPWLSFNFGWGDRLDSYTCADWYPPHQIKRSDPKVEAPAPEQHNQTGPGCCSNTAPSTIDVVLMSHQVPTVVDKAIKSEGGGQVAVRRAAAFARAFTAHIQKLRQVGGRMSRSPRQT